MSNQEKMISANLVPEHKINEKEAHMYHLTVIKKNRRMADVGIDEIPQTVKYHEQQYKRMERMKGGHALNQLGMPGAIMLHDPTQPLFKEGPTPEEKAIEATAKKAAAESKKAEEKAEKEAAVKAKASADAIAKADEEAKAKAAAKKKADKK